MEPLPDGGTTEKGSANGPGPSKRRKLDNPQDSSLTREASDESVEIVAERRKGERRKPKVEDSKLPVVSHLLSTSDGKTVISVTTEDKSINVYSLSDSGKLTIMSKRSMPKRLCAIALTPDEQILIAADKFGDVYSLPLHPSEDFVAIQRSRAPPSDAFKPSATELTVHTKGNLDALRQQQKQQKNQVRREGPDFEHKLLLGHVSLLTDVAVTRLEVSGQLRQFILTSDRDEHIRVSRYPQAHIIHGYCLGFTDFVSKICLVPWAPRLLVAGTGEPSLKVFEWQAGQLVSQITFSDDSTEGIQDILGDACNRRLPQKVAVSGIWPVPLTTEGIFLVALEGVPVLLSYRLLVNGTLQQHQVIKLDGNALDVAVIAGKEPKAIVSIDNIHLPCSIIEERQRMEPVGLITTLELDNMSFNWSAVDQPFKIKQGHLEHLAEVPQEPQDHVNRSSRARGQYSVLGEFLYGLENLRKKRGVYAEEAEEDVDGGEELMPEGEA